MDNDAPRDEELRLRYSALLTVLEQGVLVQGRDLSVIEANAAAEVLFGAQEGGLVGMADPLLGAVDEDYRALSAAQMPSAIALSSGLPVYGRIVGIQPVDGAAVRWHSVNAVPVAGNEVDDKGSPVFEAVVCSFTDVTERKALEVELTHLALHDGLTGAANRTLLVDRIGHAMARFARRTPDPNIGVSMLYVDIDAFKVINDSLGNRVGDEILRILAQRLRSAVREEDTVARIGGDEFAVLCDEMNRNDLPRFCVRVSQAFSQPVICRVGDEWKSVAIGCTAGVAMARPGEDADRFLQRVDKMLKEQSAGASVDKAPGVSTDPDASATGTDDDDGRKPPTKRTGPRSSRADAGEGQRWRPRPA